MFGNTAYVYSLVVLFILFLLARRIVNSPFGRVLQAIRGRGAVNQKGPEMAFLAALQAFKASGRRLPVNLVLVAEGEDLELKCGPIELFLRGRIMAFQWS